MPEPKPHTRAKLLVDRDILIAYLRVKLEHNDFHAVADAANDIRELDVRLDGLR